MNKTPLITDLESIKSDLAVKLIFRENGQERI